MYRITDASEARGLVTFTIVSWVDGSPAQNAAREIRGVGNVRTIFSDVVVYIVHALGATTQVLKKKKKFAGVAEMRDSSTHLTLAVVSAVVSGDRTYLSFGLPFEKRNSCLLYRIFQWGR